MPGRFRFRFRPHPPDDPALLLSEGFWPRWLRECQGRILSAPFLLLDGIASALAGAATGVLIGLAVFTGLIAATAAVSLVVTPIFQRNDARAAAANPDVPDLPIELILRDTRIGPATALKALRATIMELGIRNDDPADFAPGTATIVFDVPLECEVERVYQDGRPWDIGHILQSDTRRWWSGQNAYPILGGGGSSVGFFRITFPAAGTYTLVAKIHVSGYAWSAVSQDYEAH